MLRYKRGVIKASQIELTRRRSVVSINHERMYTKVFYSTAPAVPRPRAKTLLARHFRQRDNRLRIER